MLKNERLDTIIKTVNEKKFVTLKELMVLLDSSESTIRADLVDLESLGQIKRVHGGAESLISVKSFSEELSTQEKELLQKEEKEKIAKYASKLVKDEMFIYIDAGTSCLFLAKLLCLPNAIFVTNSAIIGRTLVDNKNKVYMPGGVFKGLTDAYVGTITIDNLEKFNFDLGFFGTNGIDINEGLTTPDLEEAMVKKVAIKRCKKSYVLADHTKFNKLTAVKFASFDNATIITDKIIDSKYKDLNIVEVK